MTATLLSVQDLKVHFGGVKAVDGVTLDLERGKLYGLVGPNGSGKTTMLNAISGMTPLTGGTLTFDDRDVSGFRADQVSRVGVSRTFQGIRLLPTLTVRENVLLGVDGFVGGDGGDGGRWGRAARKARIAARAADDAIERLDLGGVSGSYPGSLSYGTQRRVEIARAVARDPRVLLLDEPVAGMNREERQEIGAIIRSLREDGLTQLLIEHDLRMILDLCDHMFVMNFGLLVAEGEPRETASLPVVQEAYLGRARVRT